MVAYKWIWRRAADHSSQFGAVKWRLPTLLTGAFSGLLLLLALGQAGAQQSDAAPAGAWALACQALGPGQTTCSIVQQQVTENGGVLLALSLSGLEGDATPILRITVPLGIDIGAGLTLSFDDAEPENVEFTTCIQNGCVGRLDGEDRLAQLTEASNLQISFTLLQSGIEQRTLNLPVVLDGLDQLVALVRAPASQE